MANFGIDLLFASQKTNIRSPHDVLMIAFHWMLCKNNLRNSGLGENVRNSVVVVRFFDDSQLFPVIEETFKKFMFYHVAKLSTRK